MAEFKTEDLIISFIGALLVTFLFGFIVGGVAGLIVIAIIYMIRDTKEFPMEYFIGGGLGLVLGALGAAMFAMSLI